MYENGEKNYNGKKDKNKFCSKQVRKMSIFCSVVLRLDMSLHFQRFHLEKVFLFLVKHALINSSIFRQHCLTPVRGVELVVRTGHVIWNMLAVSAYVSAELYYEGTQVICHKFPYGTRHNDGLGNIVANINTM
jgi:hypothetical protein